MAVFFSKRATTLISIPKRYNGSKLPKCSQRCDAAQVVICGAGLPTCWQCIDPLCELAQQTGLAPTAVADRYDGYLLAGPGAKVPRLG